MTSPSGNGEKSHSCRGRRPLLGVEPLETRALLAGGMTIDLSVVGPYIVQPPELPAQTSTPATSVPPMSMIEAATPMLEISAERPATPPNEDPLDPPSVKEDPMAKGDDSDDHGGDSDPGKPIGDDADGGENLVTAGEEGSSVEESGLEKPRLLSDRLSRPQRTDREPYRSPLVARVSTIDDDLQRDRIVNRGDLGQGDLVQRDATRDRFGYFSTNDSSESYAAFSSTKGPSLGKGSLETDLQHDTFMAMTLMRGSDASSTANRTPTVAAEGTRSDQAAAKAERANTIARSMAFSELADDRDDLMTRVDPMTQPLDGWALIDQAIAESWWSIPERSGLLPDAVVADLFPKSKQLVIEALKVGDSGPVKPPPAYGVQMTALVFLSTMVVKRSPWTPQSTAQSERPESSPHSRG